MTLGQLLQWGINVGVLFFIALVLVYVFVEICFKHFPSLDSISKGQPPWLTDLILIAAATVISVFVLFFFGVIINIGLFEPKTLWCFAHAC
jgi:hypothetical protein